MICGLSVQLPDFYDHRAYTSLLRECITKRSLEDGKKIHSRVAEMGRDRDTTLGNLLVQMYAKCGDLHSARDAFHGIERKNNVSWTILLAAYVDNGRQKQALDLFHTMDLEGFQAEIDNFTLSCVLNACSSLGARTEGEAIHSRIVACGYELDIPLQNSLLTMYAKSGSVELAREVFDSMAAKDLISWNAILLAHHNKHFNAEAWLLYLDMNLEGMLPDSVTFVAVIGSLSEMAPGLKTAGRGRAVHARATAAGFASHTVLHNALITMYARCHCLDESRRVFDGMQDKSRVSWTSMISAYAQHEQGDESLEVFLAMNLEGMEPDEMTLSAVCTACCHLSDPSRRLAAGRSVHARIRAAGYAANPVVGTALVCMYAKSGCLDEAGEVFEMLGNKDVVSWNAMIAAYVEAGEAKQALGMHQRMRLEGVKPDSATFAMVAAVLKDDQFSSVKAVHEEVASRGLEGHPVSGTALVCLYARCGRLSEAVLVFETMLQRSTLAVAAWNSIFGALAKHGYGAKVVELFRAMALEYVQPDPITFTTVFHACSHAGLLETGVEYFVSMMQDFETAAVVDHYVCLIDLLGRAGMAAEAESVIHAMPFEPDEVAWKTLLASCQASKNNRLGSRAATQLTRLDPLQDSPYVLLSNAQRL